MAKHIVIHAGQHKTGSKSIQRYISDNTLFLRRHGLFPCPEWKTDLTQVQSVPKYNAAAIAHAMLRTDLLTPVRLKGRHNTAFRPALSGCSKRCPDLGRVVAVVVDQREVPTARGRQLAIALETPANTPEVL